MLLLLAQIQSSAGSDLSRVEELANLPIEELLNVKITSIATGTKKTVVESPAIASVITAQEIEAMGATTLEEALESIPGLHVSRTDVYAFKFQIRGISTKYTSQVLVMINGIPITSIIRNDQNTRLGVLPVKMISRIEVIRGPGSALYGADAVIGVINVITKKFSDINGTEVGGRVGSFRTNEFWYLQGATYGDLNTSLMMTYQETAGQKREIKEDAQSYLDRVLGTKVSLAPGPVNLSEKRLAIFLDAERARWRLRGSFHDLGNVGTGQGAAEALDPKGKFSLSRSTLDLTYHNSELTENWDLTSQVAYYHSSQQMEEHFILFPAGTNLGNGVFPKGVIGNPELWERQIRFANSGFFTGFKNHRVRVGVGYFFNDLYNVKESRNFDPINYAPLPVLTNVTYTEGNFLPKKSRHSFHTYAQDEWQLADNWEFTNGVRFDHYSDFGGTLNPRVALVWKTNPDLTTKFLYGQAFRAPSFSELYTKNNPVTLGNSNLKSESIQVYELAWGYQFRPDWSASLNLFHYKTTHLIAYIKDPSGLSVTAQNYGIQTGDGFEIETILKTSSEFSFTGNYAFVNATDKISGKPAGEYPAHKVYAREDWIFQQNWRWGTQLNWTGARERIPTDTRAQLSGYTTVDMTLGRREVFKRCDMTISVRNLFDEDVREPSQGPGPTATSAAIPNDLPQAGRSINASLTYRF